MITKCSMKDCKHYKFCKGYCNPELIRIVEALEKQLKDSRDAYDHLSNEYRNLDKSFKDWRDEAERLKKIN